MVTLCAAGLALGCASTPQEETVGGSGSFQQSGGGSGSGATGGGAGGTSGSAAGGAVMGLQDAETEKLQQELDAIYFDYDSSTIRPEAASKLQDHANTIRDFPDWADVTIEGHCDERGSEEYNLALGDRRADAVKRYLVTLGVDGEKLRTVSYGELRPAVDGHDETAWRWNRRSEFKVSK